MAGGKTPFNSLRLIEEPTVNNTSDQILVRKTDGNPLTETGNVDTMSKEEFIGELPFVPLAGTNETTGPITGNLEFLEETKLYSVNPTGQTPQIKFSEAVNLEVLDTATEGILSQISLTSTEIAVFTSDINSKGIVGNTLYDKQGDPNAFAQMGDITGLALDIDAVLTNGSVGVVASEILLQDNTNAGTGLYSTIDLNGGATSLSGSTSVSIGSNTNNIDLDINGLKISNSSSKPAYYNADYSANYTSRSLVDKAYVDSVAGGGSGTVTNVTGVSGEITVATGTTTPVIGISSTYTTARDAHADAKVANTITDGITTSAPNQDVVFDALALKANLASPTFTGTVSIPSGGLSFPGGGGTNIIIGTGAAVNGNTFIQARMIGTLVPNNSSIASSDTFQVIANKTQGQINNTVKLTSITTLSSTTVAINIVDQLAYYSLSGATALISLPPISGNSGKEVTIVNKSGTIQSLNSNNGVANDIWVSGTATNTTPIAIGAVVTLFNDGVNWVIISKN